MKVAQRNVVEVQDLEVKFYTYAGIVEALDGVNIFIKQGEILGLVGETGCGKSVTSLSIMKLVPPPGRIEGGSIILGGGLKRQDILTMEDDSVRLMRGKDISMIFQEPRAYLNPVYTVENQIAEVMYVHRKEELLKKSLGLRNNGQSLITIWLNLRSNGTLKSGERGMRGERLSLGRGLLVFPRILR
jgi:peptide/nickel transport system ATP-binding protein